MAKKVLVVGGGIIGASIALHLVRTGSDVTVLDACDGGGLATSHAFAWINASWGNPQFYFQFRRRSMAGWARLKSELLDLPLSWCGGLLWDLPADELAAYAEEYARWGYGVRFVDRSEALQIEPHLISVPERVLHIAEEGMVEPVAAARIMLDAAIALGAKLVRRTRVASLCATGASIVGVAVESGETLEADEVVVAAGTDTPRLLKTVGVGLKLDTPPGLIMHSTVSENRLLNGLIMSPDCHMRQTHEGRIIAGADFAGADPKGQEVEMARRLLDSVKATVGGAEGLEVGFFTVGYRPTPADGFPAIGRIGNFDGLYVTVLHSGITLAPLVGELAAREITTGMRDPDLAVYDPRRATLA